MIESLDATDFLPLLRSPHCISAAVAMPHKVSIMSEVDALIKGAHVIGAINTIVMHLDERGGRRYIGANTDCISNQEAFLQNLPRICKHRRG